MRQRAVPLALATPESDCLVREFRTTTVTGASFPVPPSDRIEVREGFVRIERSQWAPRVRQVVLLLQQTPRRLPSEARLHPSLPSHRHACDPGAHCRQQSCLSYLSAAQAAPATWLTRISPVQRNPSATRTMS